MLEYHIPQLSDQTWAVPILRRSGYLGSDGAFGTIFVWREVYHSQICRYQDFLLRKYGDFYTIPLGEGDLVNALDVMRQDAAQKGIPFALTGLTKDEVNRLEELLPGRFAYQEDRNAADYIYHSEDLIRLAGKKYHGKRNHISKFKRLYSWNYEELGKENMEECMALAREWCVQYGCSEENGLDKEACALRETFEHFDQLGFVGGMIRVEGKPVAFTIGEEINEEAFVVHFEKALSDYTGSYTIINREFAAYSLSGYRYINREEDLGLEGLRKAKLSYHPALLLERFNAKWQGE